MEVADDDDSRPRLRRRRRRLRHHRHRLRCCCRYCCHLAIPWVAEYSHAVAVVAIDVVAADDAGKWPSAVVADPDQ